MANEKQQERIQGPISIEAARCPICRHPAKADDYTDRGTHLCTRSGCICPTGKDTTRKQRAAVRLRVAALAFARLPEVKDANDLAGRRANRELLTAAVAYADADAALRRDGRPR